MSHWFELLVNSQSIKSIYGDETPSLKNVDVHSLLLHRDGPKLSMKFNLNEYPSSPPKKWNAQEFNTVQIVLSFLDLKSVEMSGWVDTIYSVDINISFENGRVILKVVDGDFKLAAESIFLDLESITAYTKS